MNKTPAEYAEDIRRLSRELPISKPIDGTVPPDTKELYELMNHLSYISDRINALRCCVLLNYEQENGRIRRIMAGRKKAVEKAYQKGRNAERKRRRA